MIDLLASIADCMMHQDALDGALKTQADLERYKAILDETDPDLIIETGTLAGVSALWFADNSNAKVITIDIQPQLHASIVSAWKDRVTMIYASSTERDVVEDVRQMAAKYNRVMVVLDSDHTSNHVYHEMVAYGLLVTPGCFMVVEDTLVRWMPWFKMGDGPLAAVEHYQETHPDEFVLDEKIENMSTITQYPSGWLRRL